MAQILKYIHVGGYWLLELNLYTVYMHVLWKITLLTLYLLE